MRGEKLHRSAIHSCEEATAAFVGQQELHLANIGWTSSKKTA